MTELSSSSRRRFHNTSDRRGQFFEAQRAGQPLSDEIVREHLQQLGKADADRHRMEERLRQFWAMLGKEPAH